MQQLVLRRGFSLIELMIVVAIIGMLMVVALPRYAGYGTRARLTEAMQLLAAARISVAEYAITRSHMPEHGDEAGLEGLSSSLVETISYSKTSDGGVLTVRLRDPGNEDVHGKHFSLVGLFNPNFRPGKAIGEAGIRSHGVISWTCRTGDAAGNHGVPVAFLPADCRNQPRAGGA